MVDVAMLDGQVAILENAIARYFATGEVPGPIGARHPSITPFDAFATDDGYVVVCAGNDALFAKLCATIGCDGLASDARFASNELRTQHVDALKVELERALAGRSSAEWLAMLEAAGIPAGALNNVEQVLHDPHVAARNMIVSASDASGNELRMAGNPIKMSAFDDPATRRPAPDLDADREAILRDF